MPVDQRWDALIIGKSGMLSGSAEVFQRGLIQICREIDGAYFHPDDTGYAGIDDCVQRTRMTGRAILPIIGHSNGCYFALKVAEKLRISGVQVPMFLFDRTIKPCPRAGANVPEVHDVHAELPIRVKVTDDFHGELVYHDFKYEGHTSVTLNTKAQALAIDFGKRWKAKQQ